MSPYSHCRAQHAGSVPYGPVCQQHRQWCRDEKAPSMCLHKPHTTLHACWSHTLASQDPGGCHAEHAEWTETRDKTRQPCLPGFGAGRCLSDSNFGNAGSIVHNGMHSSQQLHFVTRAPVSPYGISLSLCPCTPVELTGQRRGQHWCKSPACQHGWQQWLRHSVWWGSGVQPWWWSPPLPALRYVRGGDLAQCRGYLNGRRGPQRRHRSVYFCFLLSSFLSLVLMVIFSPPSRALAGKPNTDEA